MTAKTTDAMDRRAVEALFAELGPFDHLVLSISGGKGGGPFRQLALDDVRSGLEHKLLAQLSVGRRRRRRRPRALIQVALCSAVWTFWSPTS